MTGLFRYLQFCVSPGEAYICLQIMCALGICIERKFEEQVCNSL